MITFREITETDAPKILSWRTSARVDSMMTTSISANLEQQINWLRSKYSAKDYYHWIIQSSQIDIGLVSINRLDTEKGTTSWGFYVGEQSHLGDGALVPAYVYNFLFSQPWGIETVTAEVLETNAKVIRMHEIYGYKRTPERDSFVEAAKSRQTRLVSMSLSKSDWLNQFRFHKYVEAFPMRFWVGRPHR